MCIWRGNKCDNCYLFNPDLGFGVRECFTKCQKLHWHSRFSKSWDYVFGAIIFCVCYRSRSMPMLCLQKPNMAAFLAEKFDVRIFIAFRGGQCMPGFTLRHPFLKAWSWWSAQFLLKQEMFSWKCWALTFMVQSYSHSQELDFRLEVHLGLNVEIWRWSEVHVSSKAYIMVFGLIGIQVLVCYDWSLEASPHAK